MCGIAGFSLVEADRQSELVDCLVDELLLGIESRGYDATGAAWWSDKGGKLFYSKDDVCASEWVRKGVRADINLTSHGILHTRAATTGTPKNQDNNHPIVLNNVVGVHNGVLHGYDWVFKKEGVDRRAEVDSEAIFHLLEQEGINSVSQLKGDAAIAWLDKRTPELLNIATFGGRPVVWTQSPEGSFLFASTEMALASTLRKCGWLEKGKGYRDYPHPFVHVDDGKQLTVVEGKLEGVVDIELMGNYYEPKKYVHQPKKYESFGVRDWDTDWSWEKEEKKVEGIEHQTEQLLGVLKGWVVDETYVIHDALGRYWVKDGGVFELLMTPCAADRNVLYVRLGLVPLVTLQKMMVDGQMVVFDRGAEWLEQWDKKDGCWRHLTVRGNSHKDVAEVEYALIPWVDDGYEEEVEEVEEVERVEGFTDEMLVEYLSDQDGSLAAKSLSEMSGCVFAAETHPPCYVWKVIIGMEDGGLWYWYPDDGRVNKGYTSDCERFMFGLAESSEWCSVFVGGELINDSVSSYVKEIGDES